MPHVRPERRAVLKPVAEYQRTKGIDDCGKDEPGHHCAAHCRGIEASFGVADHQVYHDPVGLGKHRYHKVGDYIIPAFREHPGKRFP